MNNSAAPGIVFIKNAYAGGGFLRKGPCALFAVIAISSGVVIILSLILPTQFWWFMFAAALICLGVWLFRCR